jgi:hypothetical protein
MMNHRELLQSSAALALALSGKALRVLGAREGRNDADEAGLAAAAKPLTPPAHRSIPVAFLISEGAVVIDFAGPWEVLRSAIRRFR